MVILMVVMIGMAVMRVMVKVAVFVRAEGGSTV